MKTKLFTIIAVIGMLIIGLASCSELAPEKSAASGIATTYVEHVYTVDELFPDGDAEDLVIVPRPGWTAGPSEEIIFKALLLNRETGVYVDVTYSDKTKWSSTVGGGVISFNGRDPRFPKNAGARMEVTFYASYNKQWGAESAGYYVVPAEYDRPDRNQ